jgi:SNF2 family DNA or RNA helicase
MARQLFAHQKEGVRWTISLRSRKIEGRQLKGVIIADDMGLGKTTTAAVAAKIFAQTNITPIVIAPTSLTINWQREAAANDTHLPLIYSYTKMPTTPTHKEYNGKTITFYTPHNVPDQYVLVVDEAHNFQDPNSTRTKKFLALAADPRCQTVILLTGTPAKNGRPLNMYPLLKAINHPIADDRREYEVRYCGGRKETIFIKDERTGQVSRRIVWKNDGATNLQEFHARTKPAILRRLKNDCLDLPPKLRSFVQVEPSQTDLDTFNNTFNTLRAEYRRKLQNNEIQGTAGALVLLTNYRRAAELAKVPTVITLMEEAQEQGSHPGAFFEFAESAHQVAQHFGVPVLNGDMTKEARQQYVDDFQAGKLPAFVGMIKAGGVGITLTKGTTGILASRPWTPGDAQQVEDRFHRIGQTGTVNIYWPQFGHVDEKVDALLIQKEGNIQEILTGKRQTLSFQNDDQFIKELAEQVFGPAA